MSKKKKAQKVIKPAPPADPKITKAMADIRAMLVEHSEIPERLVKAKPGVTEEQVTHVIKVLAETDHTNYKKTVAAIRFAEEFLVGDVWGYFAEIRKEVLAEEKAKAQLHNEGKFYLTPHEVAVRRDNLLGREYSFQPRHPLLVAPL